MGWFRLAARTITGLPVNLCHYRYPIGNWCACEAPYRCAVCQLALCKSHAFIDEFTNNRRKRYCSDCLLDLYRV